MLGFIIAIIGTTIHYSKAGTCNSLYIIAFCFLLGKVFPLVAPLQIYVFFIFIFNSYIYVKVSTLKERYSSLLQPADRQCPVLGGGAKVP